MTRAPFAAILVLLICSACKEPPAGSEGDARAPGTRPTATQPSASPAIPRTDEVSLQPKHSRLSPNDPRSPIYPQNRMYLLDEGLGEIEVGPPAPHVKRIIGASTTPASGPKRRVLTRFVHLADLQLADDESPARVAKLDTTGDTNGAFRPHEGHACRIVNAAVKTINRMHEKAPLDFVMLGGDNADNAQTNEFDWVLDMLAGGPRSIDCDSGADDDLTNGPANDVKDPFESVGLAVPYKWINGNHDVLVQGNLAIDPSLRALAVGSAPKLGTRDYRLFGAPVVTSEVPADPRRALLDRVQLMQKVAADGDGHGIGKEQARTGKAYYDFDVPGTPLRFVVVDTAAETGGSEGIVRRGDVEMFLRPALDRALAEQKIVVLNAHHAVHSLTTSGGTLGSTQPDALTAEEWLALIAKYPNVVFSVVGHSHQHKVRTYGGFWEVMTSSLLDFPGQFREIEISDEDNGWLMLKATCVDYADDGDSLVKQGRELMYMDWVSGWGIDGASGREDQNVELWVKKPTF
ncbi:MAG: hypothetical protein IT381_04960 [Deltaproteobacteria bacterium]|nr:hypothetical protein [Deltaproteobacteria bacterium]